MYIINFFSKWIAASVNSVDIPRNIPDKSSMSKFSGWYKLLSFSLNEWLVLSAPNYVYTICIYEYKYLFMYIHDKFDTTINSTLSLILPTNLPIVSGALVLLSKLR